MRYLTLEVKGVSDAGTFEAVASAPTVDRDGERILSRAFDPLPESVPVHAFHDFRRPVGRAVPQYRGSQLWVTGTFSSTPAGQEMRQLVREGTVAHVSVGFMDASRSNVDGTPTITKAELLEVSLVSVPSNREAAIVSIRALGRRGSLGQQASRTANKALVAMAELDLEEARRISRRSPPTTRRRAASAVTQAEALLADLSRSRR